MLKLFWYSTVLDLRLDEEHDRLPVAFLSDACDRLCNETFLDGIHFHLPVGAGVSATKMGATTGL